MAVLFRLTHATEEATAAGIYGIIVSAAVIATVHLSTIAADVVAVLVTLIVYWGAERYARVVAQRIHEGHRPSRHELWQELTTGWEMVTASLLPLAVLVVVRLFGASVNTAILADLVCCTLLLFLAGWEIGRS